jgi:hypothetical protein
MCAGENICALSHEVHSTEDNKFSAGLRCSRLSQLKGITSDISEFDYLIALIVMAKYQCAVSQNCARGTSSGNKVRVARIREGSIAGDPTF